MPIGHFASQVQTVDYEHESFLSDLLNYESNNGGEEINGVKNTEAGYGLF